MSPEDAGVIAAVKSGDPEALGRVRRWVDITVRSWSRHRRLEDPENACSEIFVVVWRTLCADKFQGRSALRSYVVGIARRLLARRSTASPPAPPPPGPLPGPDEALLVLERCEMVRAVLQRLSEECVTMFAWVYEQRLSSDDVGRRLGVTPGAARVRLHRCAEKFREIWKDVGERFGAPPVLSPVGT